MAAATEVLASHLINEDDARGSLQGHGKQLLDQPLAVTLPLGHEAAGGHIEEGGLGLASHCLRAHTYMTQLPHAHIDMILPTGTHSHDTAATCTHSHDPP